MVNPNNLIKVLFSFVLLFLVFPVVSRMFSEMGRALPAWTEAVVDLAGWTKNNVLLVLAVPAAIGFGLNAMSKTPQGRNFLDRTYLRLPVLGDTIRKVAVARFTRLVAGT